MTNANGRGTGSQVASAEVQLAGTLNSSGAQQITSSQWSQWFSDSKRELGLSSIENGNLSATQRSAVEANRNRIAAKFMTDSKHDMFIINTGKGQKIVAARGVKLSTFSVKNVTRGWKSLFKSSAFRSTMLESSTRSSSLARGINGFFFMGAIFSVYDMMLHGNCSFGVIPNVDWDEGWHKQVQFGLEKDNFDKAYTGLQMLRETGDYTVYWMTSEQMLRFLKTGEASGTFGGNSTTNHDFGQYPFMMVKYKKEVYGILTVPETSAYLKSYYK